MLKLPCVSNRCRGKKENMIQEIHADRGANTHRSMNGQVKLKANSTGDELEAKATN